MTGSRYKWTLVALLWIVAVLNYVDRQVIFSLFPLLQADFHVSAIQLGFLGTAFLWVYGAVSPLAGYLADRWGRRQVVLGSLIVWSAVTWLTGHTQDYGQLLATRALMGLSEACYLPAALALIADHHDANSRSRATGLHQSGLYAGIALGGIWGGWMGDHFGWRSAFTVLGVVGLIYSAILLFGLKDESTRPVEVRGTPFSSALRELLASRAFLVVVGINSLVSIAYWCVYTWLAVYLYERFGMSLTAAGFSSTFYIQTASLVGILVGGWLADTWIRTDPRGRSLTQTIGIGVAGPFLFLFATTDSRLVLLPCLVLFGLGRGFFDCNLMPVVCQIVSPGLRATAYGVLNFTSCILGGAMAALGGILKDTVGLSGALQFSGAVLIAAALWLWRLHLPSDGLESEKLAIHQNA